MNSKFISRLIIGLIFILFSACSILPGNASPGRGVTLRMARASWDTGWFQAQIFVDLLKELGYEFREIETLGAVEFYFFSAGGDVDFWANGWFPLHQTYLDYERITSKIEPVGFQVENGALQGYLIDKTTAEEFGITNLENFKDPEIAALFDNNGDGRADLIGCNQGWGCAGVIDHHLDVFGLSESVNHVQGDYSELMLTTIDRFKADEPVFFYTWTPNWTVSELKVGEDVVWLSVPFSSLPDNPLPDTEIADLNGCPGNPCNPGFGVNDIRVVANTTFLELNPAAARLFELVVIPLEDIAAQNSVMAAGENTDEEIQRHAQEWITENRQVVDQWLAAARMAGN